MSCIYYYHGTLNIYMYVVPHLKIYVCTLHVCKPLHPTPPTIPSFRQTT